MRKPIKHDKQSKHKIGKAVKTNAATNPFVIASVLAAITVVIWVIIFFWLKFLRKI